MTVETVFLVWRFRVRWFRVSRWRGCVGLWYEPAAHDTAAGLMRMIVMMDFAERTACSRETGATDGMRMRKQQRMRLVLCSALIIQTVLWQQLPTVEWGQIGL
jgi:hypothetical protein